MRVDSSVEPRDMGHMTCLFKNPWGMSRWSRRNDITE